VRPRDTHVLESAETGTFEDMERIRARKGHSRPGERRGRYKVRARKKAGERGTHRLQSTEGGTSEDTA